MGCAYWSDGLETVVASVTSRGSNQIGFAWGATMKTDTDTRLGLAHPNVLSAAWLGVVAPQGVLVMPLIVSDLSGRLGLSISESGIFASAALGGACCAGILQAATVTTASWRFNAILFAILLVASYAALALGTSYWFSVLFMFTAGAGIGALLALAFTAIEQTGHQVRATGLMFGAQAAVGSLLATLIPALSGVSHEAVYVVLVATSTTAFFAAPFLGSRPVRTIAAPVKTAAPVTSNSLSLLLALLGWGCINFANGGFWPLIGELALKTGQTNAAVGGAVSAALACSIVGGFFAMLVGHRWGDLPPLLVIGAGTVVSVIGIVAGAGSVGFVASMCLFGFLWNFGPPYQIPIISRNDDSGRGMPLALVFMKLFMAVGPTIYGFVAECAGALPAGLIAAAMATLSTILLAGLAVTRRNRPAPAIVS